MRREIKEIKGAPTAAASPPAKSNKSTRFTSKTNQDLTKKATGKTLPKAPPKGQRKSIGEVADEDLPVLESKTEAIDSAILESKASPPPIHGQRRPTSSPRVVTTRQKTQTALLDASAEITTKVQISSGMQQVEKSRSILDEKILHLGGQPLKRSRYGKT
ncbi:MAG: hypothetical protein M3R00_09640, partial [Pseudomonadota bacterium]|nr:hypothetical protein [Pseudomonadota bacterium]